MDQPQPPAAGSELETPRLSRGGIGCVAILIATAAMIVTFGFQTEDFLLGWFNFPRSVWPRVTIDWPSIVAGALAFVGFAVCVQITGRWMATWLPAGVLKSRTWSLRQTACVVAGVTLMFVLGTAMVGATHQVIWLAIGRSAPSLSGDIEPPLPLPLAGARRAAQERETRFELKNFGLGAHSFESFYAALPAGASESPTGEPLHGWPIRLGPFIGVSQEDIDFSRPWNLEPNGRCYRSQVRFFINESMPGGLFDDEGYGRNHFAANVHVFSTYRYRVDEKPTQGTPGMKLADIKDGLANTLLIGTARGHFKPWGSPDGMRDPALGINRSPDGFGDAPGSLGAHFAMADGSKRFVNSKIDPAVLKALATPNGGERLSDGR